MMNDLHLVLPTESDMLAFAARLASIIKPGSVLFLYGELGAGKTTFTRGFLRGLGFQDKVKSPTYTLVEPYQVGDYQVFHFDLYRLTKATELQHIGIEEYFSPHSICLIEWPEKGLPFLPQPDLACYIAFAAAGRDIHLKAHSALGQALLLELKKE
jgi:tRNA threonylcarbamoyladenosine biosynthesis protein TsaE